MYKIKIRKIVGCEFEIEYLGEKEEFEVVEQNNYQITLQSEHFKVMVTRDVLDRMFEKVE